MEYRNLQAQKYKLDSKSKTLSNEQEAIANSKGDGSVNIQQQLNELLQAKTKLEVQIDQIKTSLASQDKSLEQLNRGKDEQSKTIYKIESEINRLNDISISL